MKKLIGSILFLAMSFTTFCQTQAGNTYKPVFYGKMNTDTVYCFDKETTRQIVKDIITSRDCDTTENIQKNIGLEIDTLIDKLNKNIKHLQRENSLQSGVIVGMEKKNEVLKKIAGEIILWKRLSGGLAVAALIMGVVIYIR